MDYFLLKCEGEWLSLHLSQVVAEVCGQEHTQNKMSVISAWQTAGPGTLLMSEAVLTTSSCKD